MTRSLCVCKVECIYCLHVCTHKLSDREERPYICIKTSLKSLKYFSQCISVSCFRDSHPSMSLSGPLNTPLYLSYSLESTGIFFFFFLPHVHPHPQCHHQLSFKIHLLHQTLQSLRSTYNNLL